MGKLFISRQQISVANYLSFNNIDETIEKGLKVVVPDNFTTIDNAPRGCGPLDGEWIHEFSKPDCKPYCNDTIARYLDYNILVSSLCSM